MGRVDLAWQLFNESFTVLAADAEMLLFPLLSGVSALLVGTGFLIPLYRDGV